MFYKIGEILYNRNNNRVLLIVDGNTWPRIKIRFQLTNYYYFVGKITLPSLFTHSHVFVEICSVSYVVRKVVIHR